MPGLICVILMQMAATLTSLTIVSEKEQGTMGALRHQSDQEERPDAGRTMPMMIAFFDVIMVTAIGVFWFGVPFNGNFLLLLVSSLFS